MPLLSAWQRGASSKTRVCTRRHTGLLTKQGQASAPAGREARQRPAAGGCQGLNLRGSVQGLRVERPAAASALACATVPSFLGRTPDPSSPPACCRAATWRRCGRRRWRAAPSPPPHLPRGEGRSPAPHLEKAHVCAKADHVVHAGRRPRQVHLQSGRPSQVWGWTSAGCAATATSGRVSQRPCCHTTRTQGVLHALPEKFGTHPPR